MVDAYRAELAERGRTQSVTDAPGSWREQADRWKWKPRAAQWDEAEIARRRREEEDDRAAERSRRRHIADRATKVLDSMLASYEQIYTDPNVKTKPLVNPVDFWRGFRTVMLNSRDEYHDRPTQVVRHGGDPDSPPIGSIDVDLEVIAKRGPLNMGEIMRSVLPPDFDPATDWVDEDDQKLDVPERLNGHPKP